MKRFREWMSIPGIGTALSYPISGFPICHFYCGCAMMARSSRRTLRVLAIRQEEVYGNGDGSARAHDTNRVE